MNLPCRAPSSHPVRLVTSMLLVSLLALDVQAADVPPIKPGLWEIQTDSQQLNGKPLPDMSAQMAEQIKRMPPDMRAQMEAQMKARGIQMSPGTGAMAIRMCLTKEMLDQNRWQKMEGNCQNTALARTGNTWNWKFSCTQPPSEGEGSTAFATSESYTSDMKVTSRHNGQVQTMTMKHRAKWLGAYCGDLKPVGAPPKR